MQALPIAHFTISLPLFLSDQTLGIMLSRNVVSKHFGL